MRRWWAIPILILMIFATLIGLSNFTTVRAEGLAQMPTVDVPTVTGTPAGPKATVKMDQDPPNVRSGPGVLYAKIGVLLLGQEVSVKGRSPGGEWLLIDYPGAPEGQGWVFAPLMNLDPGELPIVEPPPTPTPLYTATIDPTLAAQFLYTIEPTRLPTYTPPAALVIPTFTALSPKSSGGIPAGLVIISLFVIGGLLGLLSLVRGR
jgi:hypothetical protein